MKLSVAVADSGALPSAFVVFRGFEQSARAAAELGYDGWLSVEILPKPEPLLAAGRAVRYLKPFLQGVKP